MSSYLKIIANSFTITSPAVSTAALKRLKKSKLEVMESGNVHFAAPFFFTPNPIWRPVSVSIQVGDGQ